MAINTKYIISLVVMAWALAASAAAQVPSLADSGHDKYSSEADGFELAVPHQCVKTANANDGRIYTCDVAEGRITVHVSQDANAEVKTDADLGALLKGFKDSLTSNPDVKLFGEAPAKIGSYRGTVFQLTVGGDKTLMVVLAWGKFVVVITGRADSKVEHSAELIGSAVQSFAFINSNPK